MKFLKALSLTFALGVLALAMLGAGGKSNVMSGTKSGRMSEVIESPAVDGGVDAGKKISDVYMHSTKAGPMPLPPRPKPEPQQQPK